MMQLKFKVEPIFQFYKKLTELENLVCLGITHQILKDFYDMYEN